jgi:hypothetical protein
VVVMHSHTILQLQVEQRAIDDINGAGTLVKSKMNLVRHSPPSASFPNPFQSKYRRDSVSKNKTK